jgi:hypothetical protein
MSAEEGGSIMPRIKIKDLSKDQKISEGEMKAAVGGTNYSTKAILPQGEDLMQPRFYGMYGRGAKLYPYSGGRGLYGGYYGKTLLGGF